MISLDEAWAWYLAARRTVKLAHRLTAKYWDALPDDPLLLAGRESLAEAARVAGDPLDDLAVVVLFSVFEAAVRDRVRADMEPDANALTNVVLKAAAAEAQERVEVGSFYRILEAYKSPALNDLIEHVNQVRKYRNWVAHGRRNTKMPDRVHPQLAYERLGEFLRAIGKDK